MQSTRIQIDGNRSACGLAQKSQLKRKFEELVHFTNVSRRRAFHFDVLSF